MKWQELHNYSSTNTHAVCIKCKRELIGEAAKFKDDQPTCPVRDGDLKKLLKTKYWYGIPPNSYFYVEGHPFHTTQVNLKDLISTQKVDT